VSVRAGADPDRAQPAANVNLPGGVQPQIQASSLVGEILRYQVKGPSTYSLTDLRGIQDWVIQRRLLTVPGVAQVVTWGGTTKEYHVEVNPAKLESYGLTLKQVLTPSATPTATWAGATSAWASSR
jgi:cobalt-zinc-cadmium resistance protein CzcA